MNDTKAGSSISVRLVNVEKRFRKGGVTIDVLNGLDLAFEQGDGISIVGASGVGKSTLLHIMGTLDRPTAGQVFFNDEDVFEKDDRELAELRNTDIGFVFQFHHLLPEFTAVENVMIPAIIAGSELNGARVVAEDALALVGLEARLHHQPGELSGGEQQRVAVARAIVMSPRILLADEPTGNLDARTGLAIHELLLRLNREQGITLVVVTHNLALARRLPRQYRLADGRLAALDAPAVESDE